MSREVCGICWCPYDEETGECGCAPPATPNCSNCASLEAQNTELDRKLAEMERKLFELQAAVFRSQGIRCSDVGT